MPLRGLSNCRCSPLDVLAWTGSKFVTNNFDNQKIGGWSAVRVSGVYARYIHNNTSVFEGEFPPLSSEGKWEVPLPVSVPWDDVQYIYFDGLARPVAALCGNVTFRHNGQWHAAYVASYNVDATSSDMFENSHRPTHVHIINLSTQAIVQTWILPSVSTSVAIPNQYSQYQGDFGGGGHSPRFRQARHGFSGDSWVISAKYGSSFSYYLQRHRFSTGESGIAWGNQATFTTDCVIQLPAMRSDDGLPWCVALFADGGGMFTGPWENNSVGDLTNPTAIPAQLSSGERTNRLDDKTGWPSGVSWGDVEVLAYDRCWGYDYVLMRVNAGANPVYYFNGQTLRWHEVTQNGVENILSFEDGSCVMAGGGSVVYRDASGEAKSWVYSSSSSGGDFHPHISANSNWIMVSGGVATRQNVFIKATADLTRFGTNWWHGRSEDYPFETDTQFDHCQSWSFSREMFDGAPVVIPHREYDKRLWYPNLTETLEIDPSYQPEDSYINRFYCGNLQLQYSEIASGPSPTGGQHYMYGGFIPVNWSLFPGCKCCGVGADVVASGY